MSSGRGEPLKQSVKRPLGLWRLCWTPIYLCIFDVFSGTIRKCSRPTSNRVNPRSLGCPRFLTAHVICRWHKRPLIFFFSRPLILCRSCLGGLGFLTESLLRQVSERVSQCLTPAALQQGASSDLHKGDLIHFSYTCVCIKGSLYFPSPMSPAPPGDQWAVCKARCFIASVTHADPSEGTSPFPEDAEFPHKMARNQEIPCVIYPTIVM